jgi:hypothetical protein
VPLTEEIVLLHPLERSLHLRDFRMTGGKAQPHMDDLKRLLSGKLDGLDRNGDDGIRSGSNSKNPHLAIQRQQRRFLRIKFLKLHGANLMQRRKSEKK